jgi:phospholipid-binding lipoprotein MlaA
LKAAKIERRGGVRLVKLFTFLFVLGILLPGEVCSQVREEYLGVHIVKKAKAADLLEDEFDDEYEDLEVYDPLEKLNRSIFWFNDKFYFYMAKPVARVWRFIMPEPIREAASNFFRNLGMPVRLANNILQLKFRDAGIELGRFTINSTLGLGGMFDPAKSQFGIRHKSEDFGQTLGHWGIPSGPYVVLPLLGPSNIRDGVSIIPDGLIYPVYWWIADSDVGVAAGVTAGITMNEISLDKDTYESIVEEQLDPYAFLRDAYLQNRRGLIEK